jgi:hypothetical protein
VEYFSGVSASKARGDRLKASLPGFIEPALASSIERVPSGARLIHEIKFDGYRVQVHLANESAKIFTRRGHGDFRSTLMNRRLRTTASLKGADFVAKIG